MKNPLQTLLIIFALGLCGLCARQWYGQVQQQKQIDALAQSNYDQTVAIQGYTNSLSVTDHQIAQMDAQLTQVRGAVGSNAVVIFGLRSDNSRLTTRLAQSTHYLEEYSNTVVLLEARVKQDAAVIDQQNEDVKNLVQTRDDYAKRLNQSIKSYNEVVAKYNDLVKQMEAMQAAQSKKQ